MDLIDREQALELIEDANIKAHMDSVMDGELHRVKRAVQRILVSMPSIRPKGKWIQNDNGTYSCNVCQSWIPEEQYHYARFCLHCGADMREVE